MRNKKQKLIALIISAIALIGAYLIRSSDKPVYSESIADVPPYSTDAYVVINDNIPEFTQEDYTTEAYEYYSDLDMLGRCGYAMACVGKDTMPTEERGSISQVKPSGWVQAQYDFVDGESLYNRCHLIGFQLTGENANDRNLITGTRYMNVEGMLPFENMIADYVQETENHVISRVTPVFDGDDLVARGVQLEAKSVEDAGEGICFHVYVYNVQPGVEIDYSTGESRLSGNVRLPQESTVGEQVYILNRKARKFHRDDCGQAEEIAENNRDIYTGLREELLSMGYSAAGCCNP